MNRHTNCNNTGIAHLGFKLGGYPLCKNRNAFVVVTDDTRDNWQICKRCEAKMAGMKERAPRKAAA